MSWLNLEGHDDVVARFRRMMALGRLASTFLFVGPPGIGKRTFALRLAEVLLCRRPGDLTPCGACDACDLVRAGNHPDLLQVGKPADRSFIPVATFIGDDEHRGRQGLCHDIALKPFLGGRRIAIIDDADLLNEESANCLLKTLEEPPPNSVMILIGTSPARQLPTIRSRCQMIRFSPLPPETIARLLVQQGVTTDATQAAALAAMSGGSLSFATLLADDELQAFRRTLVNHLATHDFDSVKLAEAVLANVESAGTEASARRQRLRLLAEFALEFYRQLTRALSGAAPQGDDPLLAAVHKAQRSFPADPELAAHMAQRCLDALEHADRNVHHATNVVAWIDELGVRGRTAGVGGQGAGVR